ncbi:RNA-directed DNA polymerase [Saccharopolyspora shandongensis]|uniref:RNA-directed DNA polymerase n=1 Tax=Saccharopolyspora shandongensis TaxID=418495 RepID=UPI0033EB83A0
MSTEGNNIATYLDVAWSQIGKSSCDLDMPDVIAHADIAQDWSNLRSLFVDRILVNRFSLPHVEIVDLPKDRLTVRPLARLAIEHRLAYEAAVYAMARHIEKKLPRSVYSYRAKNSRGFLLNSTRSWIEMQRSARREHKRNPEFLLARTDVSSFYENIDIGVLADEVKSLGGPTWAASLIGQFLEAFNSGSSVWGLPQGTNASGVLANLYLLPLDEELERDGWRYLRYSDDIYIFGSSWTGLRQILLQSTRTLRARCLSLSGVKTKIVQAEAVAEEIEGLEKDAIIYGLDLGWRTAFVDLYRCFKQSVESDPIDTRNLKFSLTQLGRKNDEYAVRWLLKNFLLVPHIAREALLYLSRFPRLDDKIYRTLVGYLSSGDLDPYPYAQQHLLIFMIRSRFESKVGIDTAWSILRNRNVEGYVREMAARYLGRRSVSSSAAGLKKAFQDEHDERVRRSLLVACYESGQLSPNWLESILSSQENWPMRRTIEYLIGTPDCIPIPRIVRADWNTW